MSGFRFEAIDPRDVDVTSYFIRRLLLIIPTFLGVSLLVFTLTRLVPGGPIERMLNEAAMASQPGTHVVNTGGKGGSVLSKDQLAQLEAYYGFDKPILVSYFGWLSRVVRLDLGTSTRYSEPVWDIIQSRFPISIFYGVVTLILTYGVCIPLGIVKAIRHRTLFDSVSSALVFIGYAVPGYVVGDRAAHGVRMEDGLVSPRRIRQRRFRRSIVRRAGARHRQSRGAAGVVLRGRQLRGHHAADEELADGQSRRGLCAHGDCERHDVSSRGVQAMHSATASFRSRRRSAATFH